MIRHPEAAYFTRAIVSHPRQEHMLESAPEARVARSMIGRWPGTVALVLAAVAAPGCATRGPTPIADPARRVEVPGVCVLPPRGDGWALIPVSPGQGVPLGATLIRFAKHLPQARVRAGWLTYTGVFAVDLGEGRIRGAHEFLGHFKQEFQGGRRGGAHPPPAAGLL